jgi:beta-N-acetylhexosaminidase
MLRTGARAARAPRWRVALAALAVLALLALLAAARLAASAPGRVAAPAPSGGPAPATRAAAPAVQAPGAPGATVAPHAPAAACALPGLRAQLAQLLIVGFPGTRPTGESLRLVGQGVGGLILFKDNVVSGDQVRSLVRGLQAAAPIPLEIGVDQEPGTRVARLRGIVPSSPSARALGRLPAAQVERYGRRLGTALAALGVTADFAPVLDVTWASGDVIGDRSFSGDPAAAGRAGVAFLRGLQAGGVAPVGKHFPGHGESTTDSHVQLPVVRSSVARLRAHALPPFQAAVRAGVPAVMVAHLLITGVDARRPASLSPIVIGGLLRQELGFRGLVVTDALEMGAIVRGRSLPEAAELAVAAGSDQVLLGASYRSAPAVIDRLEQAVAGGRIARPRVREAFLRVERFKGQHRWDGCG